MITTNFLKKVACSYLYVRKEGTKTSYYRQKGDTYLPERMSISRELLSRITHVGRAAVLTKKGSFIGLFRQNENSPIKVVQGGNVRGTIWACPENPTLFGYSDLGFSNEQKTIQEGPDLIVFRISDDVNTVVIEVYKGCYCQRGIILPLI